MSTHFQTFRIGLTFKPATWKNGLVLYCNRDMAVLWIKSVEQIKKSKLTQNTSINNDYRPAATEARFFYSETKFKKEISFQATK